MMMMITMMIMVMPPRLMEPKSSLWAASEPSRECLASSQRSFRCAPGSWFLNWRKNSIFQLSKLISFIFSLFLSKAGICDDVMETAWSTMWNVTDETPVNCERFLAGGGMYLFLKVIKSPSSSFYSTFVLFQSCPSLITNSLLSVKRGSLRRPTCSAT